MNFHSIKKLTLRILYKWIKRYCGSWNHGSTFSSQHLLSHPRLNFPFHLRTNKSYSKFHDFSTNVDRLMANQRKPMVPRRVPLYQYQCSQNCRAIRRVVCGAVKTNQFCRRRWMETTLRPRRTLPPLGDVGAVFPQCASGTIRHSAWTRPSLLGVHNNQTLLIHGPNNSSWRTENSATELIDWTHFLFESLESVGGTRRCRAQISFVVRMRTSSSTSN